MTIRAIETVYNGYRFRSRLEARWAVFFDALREPYFYELEGYELEDGTWYLPDFYLPRRECWVEVKGKEPTHEEKWKAHLLSVGLEQPVVIQWGMLGIYYYCGVSNIRCRAIIFAGRTSNQWTPEIDYDALDQQEWEDKSPNYHTLDQERQSLGWRCAECEWNFIEGELVIVHRWSDRLIAHEIIKAHNAAASARFGVY